MRIKRVYLYSSFPYIMQSYGRIITKRKYQLSKHYACKRYDDRIVMYRSANKPIGLNLLHYQ